MNLIELKKQGQLYLILSINLKTQELMYDACDNEKDRNRRIDMYREDFGPDFLFLQYPEAMTEYAHAVHDAFKGCL